MGHRFACKAGLKAISIHIELLDLCHYTGKGGETRKHSQGIPLWILRTIRPSDNQTIRQSDNQTIRPSDHQTSQLTPKDSFRQRKRKRSIPRGRRRHERGIEALVEVIFVARGFRGCDRFAMSDEG